MLLVAPAGALLTPLREDRTESTADGNPIVGVVEAQPHGTLALKRREEVEEGGDSLTWVHFGPQFQRMSTFSGPTG
jgi:hypothetical protein